ncbi:hypothetical protein ErPhphiEa104_gp044 [Erwinia phage phiEa104]|uniref:Uncharacterized protein n=8 Tax=Caudoviricetes TaxID=2731619 RepID=A0A6B9RP55_9CAUD|nr:hypothetical protein Ea21-4_gp45 [Erwinia phage phiEa21-4]YP_004327019.1 hypothetical protein ErPhphiEa104_gp044 [Erwinia phage phiEa104]AXN57366.1 hypothetical protein SUNLIREN_66 [Erwinia phage SunLIRen]AYD79596.1 hypothetical protein LINGLNFE_00088 [Enterobacter phage phi63_307]QEG07695.1 hypothetical protein [Salmonella phage SE5]QHI00589.1 hypothetical protein [Salmonella phage vB_SenM_SB18]UFD98428.1 hypothetical protein SPARTY_105 [Hafnia phage vB_HalM_SPARTY]UXD79845.1 hypothetica
MNEQQLKELQLKAELYDLTKANQEMSGVIRNVIISLATSLKVDANEFNLQQLLDKVSEAV